MQYSSSKKENLLLKFDFDNSPFDGDERQAHLFIPFLQRKLGNHQLSYILNIEQYPDPQMSQHALLFERQHKSITDRAAETFLQQSNEYAHDLSRYIAALEASTISAPLPWPKNAPVIIITKSVTSSLVYGTS
jgi:hypothetical protein